MANRYGDEGEHPGGGQERGRWQARDRDEQRKSGERPGGGYGVGGAARGYNQGGLGGVSSHEEGYTHGSYDRMLDTSERYRGAVGEDDGGRLEDERGWNARDFGPKSESNPGWRRIYGGSGLGREAFIDEWRNFERSREARWRNLGEGPQEWKAGSRGLGKAPKGYTRSDERIREDICERLMQSPYDASDVEVAVSKGEVTLTGTVRSRDEKWGIEDVAEAVLGVQHVDNQIRLDRSEVGRNLEDPTRPLHS